MQLLIFALLVIVLILFVRAFLSFQYRNVVRNRVTYGFIQTEFAQDEDLSAGDYGLKGQVRFYYQLRAFLSTAQGKLLTFILGLSLSGLSALMLGKPLKTIGMVAVAGGGALLMVAMVSLIFRKKEQENKIRNELPNALQTVSAIMEGGLAFETALVHVINESDIRHPLYFELTVMNEAMQRGRRRNEALRLWAARSNVASVSEVVAGLIQADQTGASLGAVLKHHGLALMRENEAIIQRKAERLPIKMLFPMAVMILPAVMILAAGPSMVRILQIFRELMSKA